MTSTQLWEKTVRVPDELIKLWRRSCCDCWNLKHQRNQVSYSPQCGFCGRHGDTASQGGTFVTAAATHNTWVFSAISYEQYIYMLLHFGLMWWSCKHKAASSSYTATFLTKLVNVNPVFTQFYPSFWSLWWWVLIWKHLPALRRMRVKLDTRYKCLQSWMELQTVAIMHDDLLNVKD